MLFEEELWDAMGEGEERRDPKGEEGGEGGEGGVEDGRTTDGREARDDALDSREQAPDNERLDRFLVLARPAAPAALRGPADLGDSGLPDARRAHDHTQTHSKS